MCDPVSIIGAVASLAGTAISANQQSQYAKKQQQSQLQAMERSRQARLDEQVRQQEFQRQQEGLHAQDVRQLSADQQTKDIDKSAQQQVAQVAALPDEVTGQYLSGQENTDDTVKQSAAAGVNKAAATARQRISSMARLTAYGDVNAANGRQLGATGDNMELIGGMRRGSLGVSQQEQTIPAAQVSPPNTALGDILTGAGGLAMRYGGQNFSGAAKTGGAAYGTPVQAEWPQQYGPY